MAKQTGLHQIRGKVGEHSYYRQSGVNSGLMRGINPGMSSRVKTGDEYANTRLNNAEFRNAAELASSMGSIVIPKYRPMILPFSQSKLTKAYLQLIKETSGQWGQRNAVASQSQRIADALNAIAKKRFEDMFLDISPIVVPAGQTSAEVTCGWTEEQATALYSLGISGVVFKATSVQLYIGEFDPNTGRNRTTNIVPQLPVTGDEQVNVGGDVDITLMPLVSNLVLPGYVNIGYIIVIAMPYREIGGAKYTLQEYCTFKCVPFTFGV